MAPFSFIGLPPSSKSLFNRALLVQSFESQIQIIGESSCDDVQLMKEAVKNFKHSKEINCGAAGTVFRFMALRASREPGLHILTGSDRLFQRAHPSPESVLSLPHYQHVGPRPASAEAPIGLHLAAAARRRHEVFDLGERSV